MRNAQLSIVAAVAMLAAGCAAGGPSRAGGAPPLPVDLDTAEAVKDGTDEFFKAAMTRDFAALNALVWPGQAKGFNAQAFIDDRFRMESSEYQIYVWDRARVKVAKVRATGDLLTSSVVAVRVMQTNEARPVYVNLYWRKDRGKWWLLPYPDAA
jgi:hypothetical protein